MKNIALVFLSLIVGCGTFNSKCFVHKNLNNPTSYVYSKHIQEVRKAVDDMLFRQLDDSGKVTSWADGSLHVFVQDLYSKDYWTCEPDAGTDFPASGKIGQVTGHFGITIEPLGEKTRVRVDVEELRQQIGRRTVIFPDYKTIPVEKSVPSDTYYEYLFLHKLGEKLGETDMPGLRRP